MRLSFIKKSYHTIYHAAVNNRVLERITCVSSNQTTVNTFQNYEYTIRMTLHGQLFIWSFPHTQLLTFDIALLRNITST